MPADLNPLSVCEHGHMNLFPGFVHFFVSGSMNMPQKHSCFTGLHMAFAGPAFTICGRKRTIALIRAHNIRRGAYSDTRCILKMVPCPVALPACFRLAALISLSSTRITCETEGQSGYRSRPREGEVLKRIFEIESSPARFMRKLGKLRNKKGASLSCGGILCR